MPCRDILAEEESRQAVVAKVQELTRLLCTACQELSAVGQMGLADSELQEWWREHLIQDAKRRREEKERRKREVVEAKQEVKKARRKLESLKNRGKS